MYVSAGARLTWVGQFDSYSFYNQTSTDAIQQVAAGLRNKYSLFIEATADGIGVADFQPGALTLTLRTDMDRGGTSDGAADIKSNVEDEFALVGNACVSSTISLFTSPDAGSSNNQGADYDTCSGIGDKLRNALPTWLGGTPVTDAQKTCYAKNNIAQIQSVAQNAKTYYGTDSTTAAVAQKTANQQSMASQTDTDTLANQAIADAKKHDEAQKNMLILAGVVAAVIIGLVVVLPYTRPV